jgi:hypothetical protein
VPDNEITAARLLLTEYEHIKDEQKARVGFRDNLQYGTLASMGAVIAAALSARGQASLLLLLPPVSVLLGWTYLVNDEKISAIGRYIRTEIAPRLADLTAIGSPVFGWEAAHRADPRRQARKVLQLAVDLSTFCVAPFVALVVFWASGPPTSSFMTVSVAEAVTVCVLAVQITRYTDLSRRTGGFGSLG